MGVYEQLDDKYQDIEGKVAAISTQEDPDHRGSVEILRAAADKYEDIEIIPVSENRSRRSENSALEEFLGESVETINDVEDLKDYDWFSLVDCNPTMLPKDYRELLKPGENDKLLSIHDHHGYEVSEKFVKKGETIVHTDESYGATVSLLVQDILKGRELGLDPKQATAAYYGIQADTDGFLSTDTSPKDHNSAGYLHENFEVDLEKLGAIAKAEHKKEDLDMISMTWNNGKIRGNYFVGGVPKPLSGKEADSISKTSDEILKMEEVDVVFVYGLRNGSVKVSVRSAGTESAEDLVKDAYEDYGSAGGHRRGAGATLELGLFEDKDEEEEFQKHIASAVEENAWRAVGRPASEDEEEEG